MKLSKIIPWLFLAASLLYKEADCSSSCRKRMSSVTDVINTLGSRLAQLIEKNDNYLFSPVSIAMALAMVYVGARGTTRQQMSNALELNAAGQNCLPNKVSENFKELIHALVSENEDTSLLLANGAFVQTGLQISRFYAYNLERFFRSDIHRVNFAEEEVATMDSINKWVANSTKDKIMKLINEPLDHLTVMVLVNVVYFKGLWDLPFDETLTTNSLFFGINGTSEVPFMRLQDKVNFYFDEEKRYSFVELEYAGGNMSMIIILPQNTREIPDYDLTNEALCHIRDSFELRTVTILLPRFKTEFSRELSKDLIALGMEELFSDSADLTGIREQRDLHVSLVLHKAVIEVNEKGSEASAISGVGIDGRLKIPPKETLRANHPFLFHIVHTNTNSVLFSGRVMNMETFS